MVTVHRFRVQGFRVHLKPVNAYEKCCNPQEITAILSLYARYRKLIILK
jgi:hypothetical protein